MKEKGAEDDAEMSYHVSGLPLSDTVKYILVLFVSLFCGLSGVTLQTVSF